MYKILHKEKLNDVVELMVVHAPHVSRKCEPGQFIILRVGEDGERIPLTIADYDREKETITIIYQIVGYSTKALALLNEGDEITDFVGPLGEPTKLHASKHVVGVAGGVGSAPLYPQLRALAQMGVDVDVIGFPVWSSYFKTKRIDPSYPERKKDFVRKNQELYLRNKDFIDGWLKKWNNLKDFTPTEQKFEWQCGRTIKSIWEGVIQIRPSGVRVKKPDIFQALVALVQTPIIGKYKRKLSVREAARLQSFPDSFIPDDNMQQAYKQFGNSVNVKVVKEIFKLMTK